MRDFIKDEVLDGGMAKFGEMITMSKRVYQTRIGKAYHLGQVNALLKIGKTIPEIAKILGLHESTVRILKEKLEGE